MNIVHYGYNEDVGFPEGSEIYRRSRLGISLMEVLCELDLNPSIIKNILRIFDEVCILQMRNSNTVLSCSGRLNRSRSIEGVWRMEVSDALVFETHTGARFRSPHLELFFSEEYAMKSFSGDGEDPNITNLKTETPFWLLNESESPKIPGFVDINHSSESHEKNNGD